MRGNPNVPTRVVIYNTGSFHVISISFWLRKIKDPGSGILHWLVWFDSDKEKKKLFVLGIEHIHIPFGFVTNRASI